MADRACVYIAGPLNAQAIDYIKNLHRMIAADLEVRKLGHAPFNPCLDVLTGIVSGRMEYHDYAYANLAWVGKADALYAIGSSPGTDKEVAEAERLGIPVCRTLFEVRSLWKNAEGKWAIF